MDLTPQLCSISFSNHKGQAPDLLNWGRHNRLGNFKLLQAVRSKYCGINCKRSWSVLNSAKIKIPQGLCAGGDFQELLIPFFHALSNSRMRLLQHLYLVLSKLDFRA